MSRCMRGCASAWISYVPRQCDTTRLAYSISALCANTAATPGSDRAMIERVAERMAGLEHVPLPLVPLAKIMEAHRARVAAAWER